jgi:hypothetical protein
MERLMHRPSRTGPGQVVGVIALGLWATACGSTTTLSEAPPSTMLAAAHVDIKQTGSAAVTIVDGSVTLQLDEAHLLVIRAQLHSLAAGPQTVSLRASLYDAAHKLIGDATGSAINVAAGSTTSVQLNGPAPTATTAAVTFEVNAVPAPAG